MAFIVPKRRLLKPSRREVVGGAAALVAMPYIARAQVPMTGAGKGAPGGGSILDPDTTAWLNQVNINRSGAGSAPSATSLGYVDTLIKAFKANSTVCPAGNLNDTIDQMWLLANFDTTGHSQTTDAQALTSIVNPTASTALATPVANGGSWSSNTLGWQSATGSYIDLGYNPTTFTGAKLSRDSACFGVYGLSTRAASDSCIAMGAYTGSGAINQILLKAVSSGVNAINDSAGKNSFGTTTGLSFMIRNGSAGANADQYTINSGGSNTSGGISSTSVAVTNIKYFAFARNNNATPDSFETIKMGLVFIGGRSGTNAAYAAALFTPIQAYMTSLGIQQ